MSNSDWVTTDVEKMIEVLTEPDTDIKTIPVNLAMKAKAVRHTQLIECLTEFRVQVEAEEGVGIANIETNLGFALADVAEALGINEPEDLLQVLGGGTYLAVYEDSIPYQLKDSLQHKVVLLLAKLRDTWFGKWMTRESWEALPKERPSHGA